jgi:hypothetical protein
MNRRDFLKATPKMMCASGAAMYVAGKVLDRQPGTLHVVPKVEVVAWWREGSSSSWCEIRETIVRPDGLIMTRVYGDHQPFELTKEHAGFRRLARTHRPVEINGETEWTVKDHYPVRPDWA